MNVWIYSPYRIIAEALCDLIEEIGFTSSLKRQPESEVALWHVAATGKPMPAPGLPTLAIAANGEVVTHQPYNGVLSSYEDKFVLKQALEAVRQGGTWSENRILN